MLARAGAVNAERTVVVWGMCTCRTDCFAGKRRVPIPNVGAYHVRGMVWAWFVFNCLPPSNASPRSRG